MPNQPPKAPRPDVIARNANGTVHAIEVKSYWNKRSTLIPILRKQIARNKIHLPAGFTRKIALDVSGKGVSDEFLSAVGLRLASIQKDVSLALAFLKTGSCSSKDTFETARQFKLIRDALSQIKPADAAHNKDDLSMPDPGSAISTALSPPVQTSIPRRTARTCSLKPLAY